MDESNKTGVAILFIIVPFILFTITFDYRLGIVGLLIMTGLISYQIDVFATRTKDRLYKIINDKEAK